MIGKEHLHIILLSQGWATDTSNLTLKGSVYQLLLSQRNKSMNFALLIEKFQGDTKTGNALPFKVRSVVGSVAQPCDKSIIHM